VIQTFVAKLSAKEKKILYIAIVIVTIAFLDRLFLGPATTRLKSLDEEIRQQESIIKGDLRFLSFKGRIVKENEAFNDYYSQKPQTEEEIIATFLKKIEILASQSNVNLIKVNPSESKKKKGFVEHYANLECGGILADMTQFLYAIETSDDLMKVVKLNINPKKAGSDDVIASMSVMKVIVDNSAVKEAEKLSKMSIVSKDQVSGAASEEKKEIAGSPGGNTDTSQEVVVTQSIELGN